jgi:integrase
MATIETRKSTKGVTYRVKVRLDGHPPATRSFTKLAAAKAWAADTESTMRNGTYAAGGGKTVAEAIDQFLLSKLSGKKDQKTLKARLLWWRASLGKVKLRDLTPALIDAALTDLGDTPRPARRVGGPSKLRTGATLNRYRHALSSVLTWATRQQPPWLSSNVARKMERLPETLGRTRFLSSEERAALLAAARKSASTDLYLAVVLSLSTGGRQSEIMGLRWPDVDLQRGSVVFRNTKNGDTRTVPLPEQAVALLRDRRALFRQCTDLLFPSRCNPGKPIDLRVGFRAALQRAGLTGFRWHDQRHSAASALADMGASLLDIGTILGHRSLQTTKRYAHLTDTRLRGLIEQAAKKHRVI